jgi:hypothetical protein
MLFDFDRELKMEESRAKYKKRLGRHRGEACWYDAINTGVIGGGFLIALGMAVFFLSGGDPRLAMGAIGLFFFGTIVAMKGMMAGG